MLSGNRLEIRFLKVLGLLAIFSFGTLGFLEWIEQPKQFFIDNFLVRGVPVVAILIFLIIFLTLKPQKYSVYLFVSIISFHLFFNPKYPHPLKLHLTSFFFYFISISSYNWY